MKKVLSFILVFMLVFLVACEKAETKLNTPNLYVHDNVVSWTNVTNASNYEVKINDNVFTTTETTYTIEMDGSNEYKVCVRSKNGDITSSYSKEITINANTINIQLKAPVISIEKGKISWNVVNGATSYEVHIGLDVFTTTSTTYDVPSDAKQDVTIFVKALGEKEFMTSNPSNMVKNSVAVDSNTTKVSIYTDDVISFGGIFKEVTDKVLERQLYDSALWSKFVEQFRSNTDSDGYGWRGEFFGKMMEGACITYTATHDEKLYDILTLTMRDMLTTIWPSGSLTSYGAYNQEGNHEFEGWDMWCRTWSITGMIYYYNICKDEALKQEVLECACRQLDYIIEFVGDGKMNINDTAEQWGGLASSTILESVCKLYAYTNKQEYLDFATHIINNGGSKNGNQVESAYLGTTYPFTWGAPKAGELCFFFDGVYEYYKITGIEKYRTAAINYWYLVNESEITICGGGCTKDEQFEHSVIEQCDPSKTNAMQEFCVTIHWLNFSKEIYQETLDPAIIDSMEKTIYNAVLCCVDLDNNYDHIFTSYNNIMYSTRSTSAAGGMSLKEPIPFSYGCCISQGSIATGLIPLLTFATDNNTIYTNLYLEQTSVVHINENDVEIITNTTYPASNVVNLTINPSNSNNFKLALRIPSWSTNTKVYYNDTLEEGVVSGDYYVLDKNFSKGDKVRIEFDMHIEKVYGSKDCANPLGQYNVALVFGPICLARDARLDGGNMFESVEFDVNENGYVDFTFSNTANFKTLVEVEVETRNGSKIHLINYGHAGKTYKDNSMFTIYMPTTDYFKAPLSDDKVVILINCYYKAIMVEDENGFLTMGNSYLDYEDTSDFCVSFIDSGDGYYYIKQAKTNRYLTIVDANGNSYMKYQDFTGNNNQKFKIANSSLMTYKIKAHNSGYLISANNESDALWLYSDCSSSKQFFEILEVNK